MSKFQRTVNRIMTADEAREKCQEMKLDEKTTAWIVKTFEDIHEYRDERARDEGRDFDEERGVGVEGRAAMGQSWDNTWAELCEAMTGDANAWPTEDYIEKYPEVEKVFSAFFEE